MERYIHDIQVWTELRINPDMAYRFNNFVRLSPLQSATITLTISSCMKFSIKLSLDGDQTVY